MGESRPPCLTNGLPALRRGRRPGALAEEGGARAARRDPFLAPAPPPAPRPRRTREPLGAPRAVGAAAPDAHTPRRAEGPQRGGDGVPESPRPGRHHLAAGAPGSCGGRGRRSSARAGEERAPKATRRRRAPGPAQGGGGNRPLHPARDAELRDHLVLRGPSATAPPRGWAVWPGFWRDRAEEAMKPLKVYAKHVCAQVCGPKAVAFSSFPESNTLKWFKPLSFTHEAMQTRPAVGWEQTPGGKIVSNGLETTDPSVLPSTPLANCSQRRVLIDGATARGCHHSIFNKTIV
nr:collagen alpha-1(II) chain [Dasypus novemcinctus]